MKFVLTLVILFYMLPISAQKPVRFKLLEFPQDQFQYLGIRGNTYPLSWDSTLFLNSSNIYLGIDLTFPEATKSIEYKYVIDNGKEIVWEGTANRSEYLLDTIRTFTSHWDEEKVIDPKSLPLLSVEELQEDLVVIRKAVFEVHPGLYRYNNQAGLEKAFDKLSSHFQQPRSYIEAFLAVSAFIAGIQCDHTSASYWNQESTYHSILHMQKNKLPFTFKWVDRKMIVVMNVSEAKKMQRGSEITALNGTKINDILSAMLPLISADGNTIHSKIKKAEIEGYNYRFSAFDVLFPLLFPFDGDTVEVTYKTSPSSEVEKAVITTLTNKERKKRLIRAYPDYAAEAENLWDYKVLKNNIGYLKLGSFGTNRFQIDWKKFLDDVFLNLKNKNISDLIIDIRENQGGMDDASYYLEKYLFSHDCQIASFQSQSRFLEFPESVKEHVKSWDYWFYNLKEDKHFKKGDYYVFPGQHENRIISQNPHAFQGNKYLLIGPKNVSGAFYLAHKFKTCKLGTLIGEETGGNLNGINGGAILFLKAPNSRMNINLPVLGSFAKMAMPNSGIVADHNVKQSIVGILKNEDPVLRHALDIIGKR